MHRTLGSVTMLLGILIVLATAAYGYTVGISTPTSSAGYGSTTIAGYDVAEVHYTVANVNTLLVTSIEFKLDKPANVAKARFQLNDSSLTAWSFPCALSGGVWTCTVPPTDISLIVRLDVLAYQ